MGIPPHHRRLDDDRDVRRRTFRNARKPKRHQISRLPAAKTWDQLRTRTERRNPVGQNGSSFTSASTTSGLSASTTHNPPAGSPDDAHNGPAALIRAALFSRNDKFAAMCRRRTSAPSVVLSSNKTT